MRSLMLAAVAALAFATSASAACPPGQAMSALTHQCASLRPTTPPGGPYTLDPASHRCQGPDGKVVKTSYCLVKKPVGARKAGSDRPGYSHPGAG